jgi:hypothetical protein
MGAVPEAAMSIYDAFFILLILCASVIGSALTLLLAPLALIIHAARGRDLSELK